MASGVARMVLAGVLTNEMFSVEAERASQMKEGASFLLENHNDSFDDFTEVLLSDICNWPYYLLCNGEMHLSSAENCYK